MEFQNFKRLKNREDSSDFDDFLSKSIATTLFFFKKKFAPQKIFFASTKKDRDERTNGRERTAEKV